MKQQKRRRFLQCVAGMCATVSAGAYWLSTSRRRPAYWARRMLEDSKRKIIAAPVKPDPTKWPENGVTICWIGHATVLISFYGVNILTDPVFGNRIGFSLGLGTAGPKRYIAPALRLKELPAIDVVLLSHAHMDHMDVGSLAKLRAGWTNGRQSRRVGNPTVVTAKATGDILSQAGVKRPIELKWGEQTTVSFRSGTSKGELAIEAFEVKHWGERWPSKVERGYNGYIRRREGKAILFGGDTAQTELFANLRSRGPFEAAIMPIGAYRPWIWNHCTPEEAVAMAHA
ncbi:MAG TPA: MBL fold metallo-hydrolase, partial [Candidatus Binatia bacterium]|nr:MBL fold metallo-hydrolase [Candidatus Binatia bacterium]